MDFRNAKELLKVCQEQGLSISAVMLQRELTEGEQDPEETCLLYTSPSPRD